MGFRDNQRAIIEAARAGRGGSEGGASSEPPPSLFDPAEHNVGDVKRYLENADGEERQRVILLEAEGKQRSSILDQSW